MSLRQFMNLLFNLSVDFFLEQYPHSYKPRHKMNGQLRQTVANINMKEISFEAKEEILSDKERIHSMNHRTNIMGASSILRMNFIL